MSIADSEALREVLAEAWGRASEAGPLTKDDGVTVVHYRDDLVGPVMLSAETPMTISVQPLVVMGRLLGMFFDTDRDFLLPISLEAIAELRALFDRVEPKRVLVVGHTDTTAQADYNIGLSRVRAESVKAYLTDDVGGVARPIRSVDRAVGRRGGLRDARRAAGLGLAGAVCSRPSSGFRRRGGWRSTASPPMRRGGL